MKWRQAGHKLRECGAPGWRLTEAEAFSPAEGETFYLRRELEFSLGLLKEAQRRREARKQRNLCEVLVEEVSAALRAGQLLLLQNGGGVSSLSQTGTAPSPCFSV